MVGVAEKTSLRVRCRRQEVVGCLNYSIQKRGCSQAPGYKKKDLLRKSFFFFFPFLTIPHSLWDLSSLTRYLTQAHGSESTKS